MSNNQGRVEHGEGERIITNFLRKQLSLTFEGERKHGLTDVDIERVLGLSAACMCALFGSYKKMFP